MENYSQFKTMRHIEAVRNFLQACIKELLNRAAGHDQSKLQPPELAIFNEHTPKLRNLVYGSKEYKQCMDEMRPALQHHYSVNRHHPEYHGKRIQGMHLLDLIEMLCDWKAATLRHDTGNIYKSLDINAERYSYSAELKRILKNTIDWLEEQKVEHCAQES